MLCEYSGCLGLQGTRVGVVYAELSLESCEALCSCTSLTRAPVASALRTLVREILGAQRRQIPAWAVDCACSGSIRLPQLGPGFSSGQDRCSTSGPVGCKATLNPQNQGWLSWCYRAGAPALPAGVYFFDTPSRAQYSGSDHRDCWQTQPSIQSCCCRSFTHEKSARVAVRRRCVQALI